MSERTFKVGTKICDGNCPWNLLSAKPKKSIFDSKPNSLGIIPFLTKIVKEQDILL